MSYTLHNGDALTVLPTLPTASVDALIADPPSGIGFMGETWDHHKGGRDAWVAWLASILREARRTLKPGHYGLVWALPRTSHWTGWALEQAGFEVRDRVAHIQGQGFPKHKNLLKPAVEDWWLVRNPGPAQALNVEALRVNSGQDYQDTARVNSHRFGGSAVFLSNKEKPGFVPGNGRRPAHLLLSHAPGCNGECVEGCAVRVLGEMSGETGNGYRKNGSQPKGNYATYGMNGYRGERGHNDTGTAARFFTQFRPDADDFAPFIYAAKASRAERERGCEGLERRKTTDQDKWTVKDRRNGTAKQPRTYDALPVANHHPTVKSQALMRWLVTLITPPGGVVLDCFAGSGSTGVAAVSLGHSFIGIEADADYCAIAEARLRHAVGPLLVEANHA